MVYSLQYFVKPAIISWPNWPVQVGPEHVSESTPNDNDHFSILSVLDTKYFGHQWILWWIFESLAIFLSCRPPSIFPSQQNQTKRKNLGDKTLKKKTWRKTLEKKLWRKNLGEKTLEKKPWGKNLGEKLWRKNLGEKTLERGQSANSRGPESEATLRIHVAKKLKTIKEYFEDKLQQCTAVDLFWRNLSPILKPNDREAVFASNVCVSEHGGDGGCMGGCMGDPDEHLLNPPSGLARDGLKISTTCGGALCLHCVITLS